MLYTLLKFLGWGALLAFIGGCIGWALRSLTCRREVARARSTTVDEAEVDRMRHRLANLEHVVAERDRLRIQLADVRHADSPGVVGAPLDDDTMPVERVEEAADADEPASIVPLAADDDAATGGDDGGAAGGSTAVAGLMAVPDAIDEPAVDDHAGPDREAGPEPDADGESALDLAAAAGVLGKKIKLDDLTLVEGIGPKISQLCNGIGITTWRQLADADVADLQSMLDAAGSRYSVHKPGTWPQQASLLAAGQWDAFKALTDELDGGR